MTPEEEKRMNQLCRLIEAEKDPAVFDQLVQELNQLLEAHERQIHEAWQRDPFIRKNGTHE